MKHWRSWWQTPRRASSTHPADSRCRRPEQLPGPAVLRPRPCRGAGARPGAEQPGSRGRLTGQRRCRLRRSTVEVNPPRQLRATASPGVPPGERRASKRRPIRLAGAGRNQASECGRRGQPRPGVELADIKPASSDSRAGSRHRCPRQLPLALRPRGPPASARTEERVVVPRLQPAPLRDAVLGWIRATTPRPQVRPEDWPATDDRRGASPGWSSARNCWTKGALASLADIRSGDARVARRAPEGGRTGAFQPKIGASFGRQEATVARPDRVGQCAPVLADGRPEERHTELRRDRRGGSRAGQSQPSPH